MQKFRRKRNRQAHGFVFISYEELAEQGIADASRIGYQLEYNGVVHSICRFSQHGILIWKLGEVDPR